MATACSRCGGRESVRRYRLGKPGQPERDLCAACAEGTTATYGLEPVDAAEEDAPETPTEEETAPAPAEEPTAEENTGDAEAAPAVAEEEPKPARKPRRKRSKP